MTKEQYIKITEPLRSDPEKTKRVVSMNQLLTGVVFMVYPLYMAVLYGERDPKLVKAILGTVLFSAGSAPFQNSGNPKKEFACRR